MHLNPPLPSLSLFLCRCTALLLAAPVLLPAADIVSGDVTASLGPAFFFDDAVIGGSNNDSAVFIRDYDGVSAGKWNVGGTLTLKGLGWASKLGSEWAAPVPTYAVATFIDLGPNGISGGGDDVVLGTVTDNLVRNLSSGSEYYWDFDSDIVGVMTGAVLRIQVEGFDASDNPAAISRKTPDGNTSQSGVKLSLAATAAGGSPSGTYTAPGSGFWDALTWTRTGGGSNGGDLGSTDTAVIGGFDSVTYRGVPAAETIDRLYLGESSATGQARLFVTAGSLTVSSNLEAGRANTLNDAFLEVSGGTLTVGGSGIFGRSAQTCDGSLIVSGGAVSFGGNLEMGGFTQGGSSLRFQNPGGSPAVQVGGTLVLERVALDLTFTSSYVHTPGQVITLIEYAARDGQFGNFRNGDDFNAGPNRFRIDYDVPAGGGRWAITLTTLENWSTASTPPNIVFLFSDDQGYADLSTNQHPTYGSLYPMPELDQLAGQGVRFTNAYVTAGVCHPSRVGLLLGQHQQRYGAENNWIPGDAVYDGLPLSQVTVPRRLQGLGYRTYGIGKWHLGESVEFHPNVRGFDRWYGMWAGSRSFYASTAERDVFQDQMVPDFAGETGQYLTDRIGDAAVDFIEEHVTNHPGQPFYLYVSFTAVHAPMDIKTSDPRYTRLQNEFGLTASDYSGSPINFGTSQGTVDSNRYELAAMTLAMDENIGKVVHKLAAEGLTNNTIIVYMTDNGGAGWKPVWGGNYSYNLPLKGYKGESAEEGSMRVPAIMTWPATLPSATVADPVTSLDFMASLVNAAGAPAAARNGLDGLDLFPSLLGTAALPAERVIPFRMSGVNDGGTALRKGDWKLHIDDITNTTRLYNLATDIGETNNAAGSNPEILADLQARLAAWEARTLPPLYREGMMQLDSGLIRYPISGGLRLKNASTTLRWISGDLRTPVSTGANFHFTAMLRATESTFAPGAQLWFGLGDSTNRTNFIRFGVDFENGLLRIVEGKTGAGASVPLASLPVDFSELTASYNAGTSVLTVALGDASAELALGGSYGTLGLFALGAAAMEGELTTLAPMAGPNSFARSAVATIDASDPDFYSFTLGFTAEPPMDPGFERDTDLQSFEDDPGALIESLGGGQYRVTTPKDPAAPAEFFRFRL